MVFLFKITNLLNNMNIKNEPNRPSNQNLFSIFNFNSCSKFIINKRVYMDEF